MENEFGEMSIDDKLLKQKLSAAEQIVVADNGCVCCTVFLTLGLILTISHGFLDAVTL